MRMSGRMVGVALVVAGVGVGACGGGKSSAGDAKSASIPSMPAYPDPKEQAKEKNAAATKEAKPTDPKQICAGAPDLKVTGLAPLQDERGARANAVREREDSLKDLGYARSLKAKGPTYSMTDLQALEKKGSWEELLGHAEDVAPAQRSAAWEKMVEKAAIGYLEQLSGVAAAYDAVFTSQSLAKRYPHLLKSQDFMTKRGEAGKKASENCLRDAYRGQHCVDMMKDFLKTSNTAPEVGFAFGKIARKTQNHYVAVPFFKWALDQKKDAAMCGDDDLRMAVVSGLGLPPDYENADGARHIAANVCWDNLKDAIRKELVEGGSSGYYRDNTCAVMKAKGAL
jgi:hypothetical protein